MAQNVCPGHLREAPGMGPAPNILELPLILYFVPTLDWEEWVWVGRKHEDGGVGAPSGN